MVAVCPVGPKPRAVAPAVALRTGALRQGPVARSLWGSSLPTVRHRRPAVTPIVVVECRQPMVEVLLCLVWHLDAGQTAAGAPGHAQPLSPCHRVRGLYQSRCVGGGICVRQGRGRAGAGRSLALCCARLLVHRPRALTSVMHPLRLVERAA